MNAINHDSVGVNATSVNMLKNKIEKYLRRVGYKYMNNYQILNKPMTSLSSCHLGFLLWMAILLNVLSFLACK